MSISGINIGLSNMFEQLSGLSPKEMQEFGFSKGQIMQMKLMILMVKNMIGDGIQESEIGKLKELMGMLGDMMEQMDMDTTVLDELESKIDKIAKMFQQMRQSGEAVDPNATIHLEDVSSGPDVGGVAGGAGIADAIVAAGDVSATDPDGTFSAGQLFPAMSRINAAVGGAFKPKDIAGGPGKVAEDALNPAAGGVGPLSAIDAAVASDQRVAPVSDASASSSDTVKTDGSKPKVPQAILDEQYELGEKLAEVLMRMLTQKIEMHPSIDKLLGDLDVS